MATTIAVIGTSHHTAPVEERERLRLNDVDEAQAAADLLAYPGIDEAVVVSTCNRVELYVAGDGSADPALGLRRYLAERCGVNDGWLDRFMYQKRGPDAVQHVFRVASSLDSVVIGEPQILGQVKRAYGASMSVGGAGPLLHRCFNQAFRVAKRVRSETRIAETAVSVSYAAVELAKKVFGTLDGKKVLVIGAGKMGALALQNLVAAGAREVHVVNRTEARAFELASRYGGRAWGLEHLDRLLAEADIVISSTGSQHFVVRYDAVKAALPKRKYRPLFLIDIAVPRDIDPRCESLQNVYVYGVDDLKKVVDQNLAARRNEAVRAEEIVRSETASFQKKLAEATVVPTLVGLRERMTTLRDGELERLLKSEPNLSPEAVDALTRFGHALVNKILHEPTVALRDSAHEGNSANLAAATRRLFNLADLPDPESSS